MAHPLLDLPSHLSYLLTDRQKVLVHHPDKQQQATGEGDGEGEGDDHFKCIKIGTPILAVDMLPFHIIFCPSAYDILSNKKRRQAFDSIDPTFDDTVPPNNAHSRDNFFEVFGPAFSENERYCVHEREPLVSHVGTFVSQVVNSTACTSTWRSRCNI